METSRIKAFVTAAETGSFTRAAEQLNYTPSGVSQLVTALEKELGFPLLSRTRKGVSVTESGRLLLPAARALISQEEHIYELASDINGVLTGSVTIAAFSSIATHWLPSVIRRFQSDYPNITIKLMEGIRQEVMKWLDDRLADVAFVSYQEPMKYDWIPLARDPMLAILPKEHPLAGCSSYPLARCSEEDFIMPALGRDDDVAALFEAHSILPRIKFTTLENFAAMSMVEQGLGISVMNELITARRSCDVVKLPLEPPSYITLGIASPPKASASPAVKRFLEYAVKELTRI